MSYSTRCAGCCKRVRLDTENDFSPMEPGWHRFTLNDLIDRDSAAVLAWARDLEGSHFSRFSRSTFGQRLYACDDCWNGKLSEALGKAQVAFWNAFVEATDSRRYRTSERKVLNP